jgi:hypothetical protein
MKLSARGYHRVLRVARALPSSTAQAASAPERHRLAHWRMIAARG